MASIPFRSSANGIAKKGKTKTEYVVMKGDTVGKGPVKPIFNKL